jgi:hypothetical protein
VSDAIDRVAKAEHRRAQWRQRAEAARDRRRRGVTPVTVELGLHAIAALERLSLVEPGDRDPRHMAVACSRFLAAAPHVAAIGDAIWPAEEEGA